MSKLNVNEIEANGTNTNVKVVGKGTDGACEIKGATNDATLQLNCSAQSHGVKLKAPSDSAGQNYTMILPDNQIATNKLLKVKSITGSGSSAVGQLEFADEPNVDLTTLDAGNITTGTIPAARFPTSFSATLGAGLQFVSKSTTTGSATTLVELDLDDDSLYRLIGKQIKTTGVGNIKMFFKDASGLNYGVAYYNNYQNGSTNANVTGTSTSTIDLTMHASQSTNFDKMNFIADIGTKGGYVHMFYRGFHLGRSDSRSNAFVTLNYNDSNPLRRIRLMPTGGDFAADCQFLLYKWNES